MSRRRPRRRCQRQRDPAVARRSASRRRRSTASAASTARLAALQIRQAMVGRWFFMIIGTIFTSRPAFVYWLAGYARDPAATRRRRRSATSSRSRRSRAGCSSRSASCSTSRSRSRARSRCSTGSSSTSSWTPRSSTRRTRSRSTRRRSAARSASATSRSATRRPRRGGDRSRRGDAEPDEAPRSTSRRAGAAAIDSGSLPEADGRAAGRADASDGRRPTRGADAAERRGRHPPAVRPRRTSTSRRSPGELVALVGPSGSGKTTTTYLIPRLYDVDEGAVEIDGLDVRQISLASLGARHRVRDPGDVPVPRHRSARTCCYAKPDATEAELEAAARAAAIHDRIIGAARGLRHDRRRARLQAVGRREAAHRDRARPAQGPADPDPRRGDVGARHRQRAAHPGGARAADARAARRSPSPTACRRSCAPTGSSSTSAAGSSSAARTPSCSPQGGLYARLYREQFESTAASAEPDAGPRLDRAAAGSRAGAQIVEPSRGRQCASWP